MEDSLGCSERFLERLLRFKPSGAEYIMGYLLGAVDGVASGRDRTSDPFAGYLFEEDN